MATRSGGSGVDGGCAGGGGGGSEGGRRAPGGDDEEERCRIHSIAAKKRASRRWTNWGRTPPPSLAPYAVGARMTPARARAGGPPFPSTDELRRWGGLLVGIGAAAHCRSTLIRLKRIYNF
jgi:hypothetical protein